MDQEEFERLKEAEKEHLRSIRKLKEQLRQAQRRSTIDSALRGMGTDALMGEHDAALDAVLRETLESEARLSMAMDEAALDAPDEIIGPDELADEELRKARAAELVRQLKAETGAPDAGSAADPDQTTPPVRDEEPPPDKTIGRMRQAHRNQSE